MNDYKYLFGPVPSRRLGVSLGVDVIPYKTCTLDCVYCECGCTTELTLDRKIYVPTTEMIGELKQFLDAKPKLDYVSFAGSGEPTLAANLGEIILFLKKNYPQYKVAVLTNGTLLDNEVVRKEIAPADLVKISFDAVSLAAFQKINRPHPKLDLEKMIKGITEFSQNYRGHLWLEIFIVAGLNDQKEEIVKLRDLIAKIKHEKIQLNSLDRPGAEEWVKPAALEELQAVAECFKPLKTEIVAKRQPPKDFFKKISRA